MAALDLLGHRWSLRVLWELRRGPVGARALLERCDSLSSSVLYARLRELTEAAAAAPVPVLCGGHALVSDGLRLVVAATWQGR